MDFLICSFADGKLFPAFWNGSQKILTPENFNVFRGLNGGRDKDRTCDPYDVNVVLSR